MFSSLWFSNKFLAYPIYRYITEKKSNVTLSIYVMFTLWIFIIKEYFVEWKIFSYQIIKLEIFDQVSVLQIKVCFIRE